MKFFKILFFKIFIDQEEGGPDVYIALYLFGSLPTGLWDILKVFFKANLKLFSSKIFILNCNHFLFCFTENWWNRESTIAWKEFRQNAQNAKRRYFRVWRVLFFRLPKIHFTNSSKLRKSTSKFTFGKNLGFMRSWDHL